MYIYKQQHVHVLTATCMYKLQLVYIYKLQHVHVCNANKSLVYFHACLHLVKSICTTEY